MLEINRPAAFIEVCLVVKLVLVKPGFKFEKRVEALLDPESVNRTREDVVRGAALGAPALVPFHAHLPNSCFIACSPL